MDARAAVSARRSGTDGPEERSATAALLLVAGSGPQVSGTMTVHQLFGYLLLVVSAILGQRVLGLVYRRGRADDQ